MVFFKTKVFAFLFCLLFVNISTASGQTEDSIYHLPAGTRLWLVAESAVNSKFSTENDTFVGRISRPLIVRGRIALDAETRIEGRILSSRAARGGGRNGTLDMRFETMFFERGETRDIRAVLVDDLDAPGSGIFNTAAILGTTAAGSILGGLTGAVRGSLIGAGIGAGAGSGIIHLRKGKNVGIKENEEFEIELVRDVILPYRDY